MADTDPVVTDHCLLRYFERALQFDIEEIRLHIAEQCRDAICAGAASLIVGDIRFEFRNGVVVTVTRKDNGSPSNSRRDLLARGKA